MFDKNNSHWWFISFGMKQEILKNVTQHSTGCFNVRQKLFTAEIFIHTWACVVQYIIWIIRIMIIIQQSLFLFHVRRLLDIWSMYTQKRVLHTTVPLISSDWDCERKETEYYGVRNNVSDSINKRGETESEREKRFSDFFFLFSSSFLCLHFHN